MSVRRYGADSFEASNEDKVLFPDRGITKGDLIDYYERIAGCMLGHVRGRPVTMHRFPDGIEAEGFYEKRLPGHFPEWVDGVQVRTGKDGESQRQVAANKRATLAYLAQQACIAPSVWLSREGSLERPDQAIIDLDPADGGGFEQVRTAARRLGGLLDEMGVVSFVKLTGSRGVHVVIPLRAEAGFDEVRGWARALGELLAQRHPEEVTTAMRKDQRGGRLFLDTGRNAYGQTAVAPYAVRARAGAPIAAPIRWEELSEASLEARSYTIENIHRRVGQVGDVWSGMGRHRRSLGSLREALERVSA
ncbi:MAG: non-homologous end-joining DNA ligase [Phycisphaerales bacterium]